MNRKLCPHCGTENPDIAAYCKRCGEPFVAQIDFPENPQAPAKESFDSKLINRLTIGACVITAIAAVAVLTPGSSDNAAATTAQPYSDSSVTQTTTVAQPSLQTTTVESTTAASTVPTSTDSASVTTQPTAEDIASICENYNKYVINLKNNTESVSIHKTEKISLEITHFSLPVPTETINAFMMRLIPETDVTYTFTGGIAKEDKSVKLVDFIPPATETPTVTPEDLLSAERDANGTITLKFKADKSSFADGKTDFPLYVGSATDVLDFATFSLGPVKIVKAEIEYPATEIRAEVNTDGSLKKLTVVQPVNATSTGGVGSLTADVGMKLKATTTFEIR